MAINIKKIKEEYEDEHKDKGFDPLPKGVYNCFVYDLEGRESKSGNPMIEVQFKIATGEYANRRQWTYLVLTPAAWWKVEEFFEALDYSLDDLPEEADTPEQVVAHIRDDIIGEKVCIKVNHGKYDGKITDNVDKVMAVEKDFEVEIDDDEDVPF